MAKKPSEELLEERWTEIGHLMEEHQRRFGVSIDDEAIKRYLRTGSFANTIAAPRPEEKNKKGRR